MFDCRRVRGKLFVCIIWRESDTQLSSWYLTCSISHSYMKRDRYIKTMLAMIQSWLMYFMYQYWVIVINS